MRRRDFCRGATASASLLAVPNLSLAQPMELNVAGSGTWFGHVPIIAAIDRGFFKDKGLNVEFKPVVKSSDRMLLLAQGGVQWANVGGQSAMTEIVRGNDTFYWLGNVDDSPDVEGIVTRSAVADLKDLRGKKVGVQLNSSSDVNLIYWLQTVGMTLDDIQIVPMPPTDMLQAFVSGNIDAFSAWDPFVNDALSAVSDAQVLATGRQTQLFLDHGVTAGADLIVMSRQLADQHPEEAKKLMEALFQGIEFTLSDPAQAAASAERWFKRDAKDIVEGLKKFSFYGAAVQKEHVPNVAKALQAGFERMHAQGQIDSVPDANAWHKAGLFPEPA